MEKIAVVTDSSSGMTIKEAEERGIYMLPMVFFVEGKEYREGVSLAEEMFFDSLHQGAEVATSQLPPADIIGLWDELLKTHDKVMHIPMTKALSGGHAMTVALSEDYDGKVIVVDSRRISVTQESMAIHAKELADVGMSAEQIKEELEKTALDADIYITVETLKYLKKSGRVSRITALAGDMLNVKPVIQIKGGMLEPCGKARGRKKARKMMEDAIRKDFERLADKFGADKLQLYVAHANAAEEAAEWGAKIEDLFPGHKVHIAKLPMNICCHVGPGTIGIGVSYR